MGELEYQELNNFSMGRHEVNQVDDKNNNNKENQNKNEDDVELRQNVNEPVGDDNGWDIDD